MSVLTNVALFHFLAAFVKHKISVQLVHNAHTNVVLLSSDKFGRIKFSIMFKT